MSGIVAIHQPDFFPWQGFFSKIRKADVWVDLDHVINRTNEQSWFRRVNMDIFGRSSYISISVEKDPSRTFVPICEMRINQIIVNKDAKIYKSIRESYKKTPFFDEYFSLVDEYFSSSEVLLAERNRRFIKTVIELLEIEVEIVKSSDLQPEGKSTEMLIDLIRKMGGSVYLSGDGAAGYQNESLYAENNIELRFNNFKPRLYQQRNVKQFIPGLSVLDSLFNVGAEETKRIINSI